MRNIPMTMFLPRRERVRKSKRHREGQNYDVLSDIPKIDEDEEISEDASPEFLEEIKNHEIVEVVRIVNKKEFDQDFMEEILVNRDDNKAYIFYEGDYQYLKKNDIEDIYYLCLKGKVNYHENGLLNSLIVFLGSFVIWERVHDYQLGIESYQIKINLIVPTLIIPEKVVKEVSAIVCVARYILKEPPLGDLDEDIIELFETKIKKHLKHRRKMRRWESFVNGRPIP
ncbi:hypothetical protein Tco_1002474 [Tanacetum coccineum]|uniref:Uncharacterized protein n=1 Tax=Tanacetum coccineum TaxID=301880 RepID=A0ABQ5F6D4_9ASTR